MSHFDYIVRYVPGYGYVPIVVLTVGSSFGSERELGRGSFYPTATDAFHAALKMGDQARAYEPDLAAILDEAEGHPRLIG